MHGHRKHSGRANRYNVFGRRCRAGAALVETAIILPLLITLFLACVDFGRYAYAYITLTNAVRAGGAVACSVSASASLTHLEPSVHKAILDEFFGQSQVDPERLVIAALERKTDEAPPRFTWVRVRATYRFTTIINWPALPNEMDLEAEVKMRVIR